MDKIKVFVDLDDTLIDISHLKEKLFAIVEEMGVPREKIEPAYEASKDEHGIPILSKWLGSYEGIDSRELERRFQEEYKKIGKENLFRERWEYLKAKYPSDKYELHITTKGEPRVQGWKTEGIDLSPFTSIQVVYENKAEALKKRGLVRAEEQCVLIDNSEEERVAMAEIFPQAELIDPLTIDEEIKREGQPPRREG